VPVSSTISTKRTTEMHFYSRFGRLPLVAKCVVKSMMEKTSRHVTRLFAFISFLAQTCVHEKNNQEKFTRCVGFVELLFV